MQCMVKMGSGEWKLGSETLPLLTSFILIQSGLFFNEVGCLDWSRNIFRRPKDLKTGQWEISEHKKHNNDYGDTKIKFCFERKMKIFLVKNFINPLEKQ